jgi:CheY-like chemotaxis protein
MNEKPAAILVAEDEPAARLGLRSLLSDEGFEVQAAADGLEALAKLETFHPDILLIDIKMPRLDGVGFFRRARELLPHIPAIFMTGMAESTLVSLDVEKEPRVFILHKPVDVDELLPLIARGLGR